MNACAKATDFDPVKLRFAPNLLHDEPASSVL